MTDRDAVKWLVLDNLKNLWPYTTNICDRDKADAVYRWCVDNELVKDGCITDAGRAWLLVHR